MPTLTVFIAVIVVVSVSVRSQPPPPAPCCMARKFSADLTDMRTINTQEFIIRELTLDFDQQKQAIVTSMLDPRTRQKTYTSKDVYDFTKMVNYFVPAENVSSCIKKQISWPMPPQCVPRDADYLGSTYLGLPYAFPYNEWRFTYKGAKANLTMGFSSKGCVPIFEGITGDMNGPVDFLFLFSSYTDVIDTRVFQLPASCNAETV